MWHSFLVGLRKPLCLRLSGGGSRLGGGELDHQRLLLACKPHRFGCSRRRRRRRRRRRAPRPCVRAHRPLCRVHPPRRRRLSLHRPLHRHCSCHGSAVSHAHCRLFDHARCLGWLVCLLRLRLRRLLLLRRRLLVLLLLMMLMVLLLMLLRRRPLPPHPPAAVGAPRVCL